jgi:hypothetical protein
LASNLNGIIEAHRELTVPLFGRELVLRILHQMLVDLHLCLILLAQQREVVFDFILAILKDSRVVLEPVEDGQNQLQGDPGENKVFSTDLEHY